METNNKTLAVYTIVERKRDGKKFWTRIGGAFRNQDGSLNVVLDAMPVNGTLHIREPRVWSERGAGPASFDDAHALDEAHGFAEAYAQ